MLACITRPHECPSASQATCAIIFCAAAVPCTHACSSKTSSNLSSAYNNPSYIAPMQYCTSGHRPGHRLRLTVSEMWCQQACFDRPNVWGWPNRRGRVPAVDLSRIAVQQHPARLTIPRSLNGNLAVRELECTYDGSSHRPCLILTPNRIQFRTRETLCAHTHICRLR